MSFNPDFLFTDGFDKYGPIGTYLWLDGGVTSQNIVTEWDSSLNGNSITIQAALGGTGNCVQFVGGTWLQKGLPANYARAIGGFTISSGGSTYFQLYDGSTAQLTVMINSAGKCEVRRGTTGATIIATSAESFVAGDTLEYDISIHGSTGIIKIYKNNVLTSINLTAQDTNSTANNYFNTIRIGNDSGTGKFDHFFIGCYTAAGGGDAPLLYSPIIETSLITAEDAVQSAIGAACYGYASGPTTTGSGGFGANGLLLIPFTPVVNCTLDSVGFISAMTQAGNNVKAVLYNSTGTTKIAEGTVVTGLTQNAPVICPFATGQSLTAGTTYWFGIFVQSAGAYYQAASAGSYINTGGTWPTAPSTFSPSSSTAAPYLWANLSGITDRTKVLDQIAIAPPGLSTKVGYTAYVYEDTAGQRDSYVTAALVSVPASIAAVSVKALLGKSDGGARTVDLEVKSGATFGAGNTAGISPSAALNWYASHNLTDPNTAAAWTGSNASSCKIGFKVAS